MGTVAYRVDRVRFLPENPSSIVPITISGVGVGAMAVPCLQREQGLNPRPAFSPLLIKLLHFYSHKSTTTLSDIHTFTSEVVLAKTPGISVYLDINLHPVELP
ncbi:uncharacterized protein LOC106028856 isoform X3 [Cavia porcellus]|uniref:uncharacterized protein LOC106028856 isoform X3 n=1 Tax=Cavia porcellus TaxID=10141 RepID=UPI002FE12359